MAMLNAPFQLDTSGLLKYQGQLADMNASNPTPTPQQYVQQQAAQGNAPQAPYSLNQQYIQSPQSSYIGSASQPQNVQQPQVTGNAQVQPMPSTSTPSNGGMDPVSGIFNMVSQVGNDVRNMGQFIQNYQNSKFNQDMTKKYYALTLRQQTGAEKQQTFANQMTLKNYALALAELDMSKQTLSSNLLTASTNRQQQNLLFSQSQDDRAKSQRLGAAFAKGVAEGMKSSGRVTNTYPAQPGAPVNPALPNLTAR